MLKYKYPGYEMDEESQRRFYNMGNRGAMVWGQENRQRLYKEQEELQKEQDRLKGQANLLKRVSASLTSLIEPQISKDDGNINEEALLLLNKTTIALKYLAAINNSNSFWGDKEEKMRIYINDVVKLVENYARMASNNKGGRRKGRKSRKSRKSRKGRKSRKSRK
jgi:hypothetical protein